MNYTTTEQVIGTYLGKPLYQKTIVFGNKAGLSNPSLSTGIANVDKMFIDMAGSQLSDGGLPFPYVHTNLVVIAGCFFNITSSDATLEMRIGSNSSSAMTNVIITVRYTKTTD